MLFRVVTTLHNDLASTALLAEMDIASGPEVRQILSLFSALFSWFGTSIQKRTTHHFPLRSM